MARRHKQHLDRAKRFLEKTCRGRDRGVFRARREPQHQEATQRSRSVGADGSAGPARLLRFSVDLLVSPRRDQGARHLQRFLRVGRGQQLPERIARYAFLQKTKSSRRSIEQYSKAAELFAAASREEGRAVLLGADCPARSGESFAAASFLRKRPNAIGKTALAARAFLRPGSLLRRAALQPTRSSFLGRAYTRAQERSVGLLYAQANLQTGNAVRAVALLEPFAASESDAAFIATFSDALMRSGNSSAHANCSTAFPRKK